MYRETDRKAPMSPQLALRVAIIGGVTLVIFGIIFFRLWYLQVLSGDQYLAEANNNRVREIKVEAPRGELVDRDGQILVDNRQGKAVKIVAGKLPEDARGKALLYARLAKVLDMNRRELREEVNQQFKMLPFSSATAKADVDIGDGRLPPGAPEGVPGRHRRAGLPAPLPAGRRSARTWSATSHRSPRTRSRTRSTRRASSRATASASPASRPPTTASCAAATARAGCRSTRSGARAAS